jgi:ketosteroid isomerase-like protein
MAREDVERVREGYATFNREGLRAMVDVFWTPDIVWDVQPMRIPGLDAAYRGADEVIGFFELWLGSFDAETWTVEPIEITDLGDRILVVLRQRGAGASSGVEVELEFAQLIETRDGRAARATHYLTKEEALAAAGSMP